MNPASSKYLNIKAKIISNRRLNGNYGHLEFESGWIAKQAVAGQFVNIKVSAAPEPLLRRPVSIHGVKASKVKIIYEIIGRGTQILAARKPGEFLDLIGPLGNGFDYLRPLAKSTQAKNILVAGGMGVAPLVFLADKLTKLKTRNLRPETIVLMGAKTKEQIICRPEFIALSCTVKLATDDGSLGLKGRVTDLLSIVLGQAEPANLFACGPHSMLKTVAQIAHEHKVPAQLSLEEHMACGIGACLGCVVATKTGYKSACKDGPVFSSEELIW
jgi:dihydroorotate dehydrogenase electron transfer subunit